MEVKSQENTYDVIVIGAGVVGVSTGLFLAKKGVKTLILEQFGLRHSRGGSNGASRLVRFSNKNEIYVNLAEESLKLWEEIEFEHGEKLMRKCNGIIVAMNQKTNAIIKQTEEALIKDGMDHEMITGREINERWPIFRVQNDKIAIFEEIRLIFARKAIDAMLIQFVKKDGKVLEHKKVVAIQPIRSSIWEESITIETYSGDKYFCKKVIVCSGPWMNHVLSLVGLQVPISPQKVTVPFWKVKDLKKNATFSKTMPIFLFSNEEEVKLYYGIPEHDYPGVIKIAAHDSVKCDPDHPSRTKQDPNLIPKISRFISENLHEDFVEHDNPSVTEECIYTLTPDYHPIIDKHPIYRNILFCGGFSGQGFRLAPVIGRIMTDLVLGNDPKFDRDFFSLKRFAKSKL